MHIYIDLLLKTKATTPQQWSSKHCHMFSRLPGNDSAVVHSISTLLRGEEVRYECESSARKGEQSQIQSLLAFLIWTDIKMTKGDVYSREEDECSSREVLRTTDQTCCVWGRYNLSDYESDRGSAPILSPVSTCVSYGYILVKSICWVTKNCECRMKWKAHCVL